MSVLTWAEERSNAMTLWDVGALKVSSMLFGVLVGAYLAPFVMRNVTWLLVLLVLLGGRSGYRWLTAPARSFPSSRPA